MSGTVGDLRYILIIDNGHLTHHVRFFVPLMSTGKNVQVLLFSTSKQENSTGV